MFQNRDLRQPAYAADLLTALREQLGLDLKSEKALMDVVIVESATKPAFD